MNRQTARPWIVAAVALVLIVPILVGAGLLVRGYTRSAFANEQRTTSARAAAFDALQLQLDEETGVRGYAATHQAAFLQPDRDARLELPRVLRTLHAQAVALQLPASAIAAIDDAIVTNATWRREVAQPLIAQSGSATLIQQRGKTLVDRYRGDMATVQAAIGVRKDALDVATEMAIDRLNVFVALVATAIVAMGIAFAVQQSRLTSVLVAKEREAAELAAAFQTEKRLAETLQDAFTQRPLPLLPSVSFSATFASSLAGT